MHPILAKFGPFIISGIELGPIYIYTYGLMVALGFLGAITLSVKLAKIEGISQDSILDLCFWILIFSIIGARIFYVILNFSFYQENPLEVIQVYKGGLVFYGGFISGIMTCVFYTKKYNLPIWKIGDILAPGIAFGEAIGRIGCFFNGCCYGKETTLPWGIKFPPGSLSSFLYGNEHHIHPTQIYAFLSNIIIFAFLFFFFKRKKFQGQIFWLYVILYAVGRFFVEIWRGDIERGFFMGIISTSQTIAVIFLIIGISMYFYLSRRKNI
ncbi:MAG: prolipoprotein diacylglyceryl transferase [Candidatus Firestonebacteria bacterium]|nr:prolipoprotein diacylglyceryl transferase [Candidatus Firestonebacteria bacterium]